jgi:tetratricopeptide (TPR) repeat protein
MRPAKEASDPMKARIRLLLATLWLSLLLSAPLHAKDEDSKTCIQTTTESMRRRGEGDFVGALKLANQAIEGACSRLPATNVALGFALLAVGTAKMELRDWTGAETALTAGLANYEKNLGAKDELTAGALNDVGAFYTRVGHYAKARELLLRAIAMYQEIGDKTLDVGLAQAYDNLANSEFALDHYTEAEQAQRKSLQLRAKVLGSEDRKTIESLLSLGHALREQCKYVAAKREFELALARSEKAFGPNDPLTGDALNGIGAAQFALGHVDQAETLVLRSLAIVEKSSSPDPIDRASRLHNLGLIAYTRNQHAKAETLLLEALAINENAFGIEHPELLKVLGDLVKVNQKLNKPERTAMFEARVQQIKSKPR